MSKGRFGVTIRLLMKNIVLLVKLNIDNDVVFFIMIVYMRLPRNFGISLCFLEMNYLLL